MQTYIDGNGVAFADHRLHLPKLAKDFWPPCHQRIPRVLEEFHATWDHCFACGRPRKHVRRLEAHHIIGGIKGRSDEPCNLMMLCEDWEHSCHRQANSVLLPKGVLLWRKWSVDPENTDWVRLAILHRQFLPDIEYVQEIAMTYNQHRGR